MSAATGGDEPETGARNLVLAVYILQALGLLLPVLPIVGVILSHLKRDSMRGSVYESHCRWQIRTFWWALFWLLAGSTLVPIMGIGFVILALATVWYLYRVVRGFLNCNDRLAMPVAGG